jgi:predicted integral membrane protein DUF2269
MYNIVLFLHVLGFGGLAWGIGLQLVFAARVNRARSVQDVRAAMGIIQPVVRIFPPASGLIILTGIYMVIDSWSWEAGWPGIALLGVILLSVTGSVVLGRRATKLGEAAAAAPDGPLGADVAALAYDRVMHIFLWLNLTLVVAIVYMMTNKPGVLGSLLAVVVAALAAVAIPTVARAARPRAAPDRQR